MIRLLVLLALLVAVPAAAQTPQPTPAQYREDAESIEALINEVYAYPERLPGGRYVLTPLLRAEAARVSDGRSLLRFAERALFLLADHHAITGSSFRDSYALVPSYSDLWIGQAGSGFIIEAVREGSPAAAAGIRAGDRLVAIDGVPAADAAASFWRDLGAAPAERDAAFAARVLAAGRRDRPRRLTIRQGASAPRVVALASLYSVESARRPPVSLTAEGRALRIRINDSLGDNATVAAFDAAMAQARPGQLVIVDLTDTPGGGNSSVARGMLSWFVDRPSFYQRHNLPAEERETGIARQWVEQVLPRPGKRHRGPVRVEVARWTGSMGEGLAIGFDALGVPVTGTRMAGLLGAVYDRQLRHSGLLLKLPAERLSHVNGTPREASCRGRRAEPGLAARRAARIWAPTGERRMRRTGGLVLLMLAAACGGSGGSENKANGSGSAPVATAPADQRDTAGSVTLAASGPGGCSARWGDQPATPEQVLARSAAAVEQAIERTGGVDNLTEATMPALAVTAPANLPFACADTYLAAIRRAGVVSVLLTAEGGEAALADFSLADIAARPPTVVLAIGAGGRLSWNGEAVTLAALPERLTRLSGGAAAGVEAPAGELELRPAREASFGQIHAVLRQVRSGHLRAALLLPSVTPARPEPAAPPAPPPPANLTGQ